MTPLATIDLVGWDIHRAIVDNVFENTQDEARATLELPGYMARLMGQGVLGNKSGGGFFKRDGRTRLVLDPASGDYRPEAEVQLPKLDYIEKIAALHNEGRYREGYQAFLSAEGEEAALARRVIAGYISYAFHRVGEATDTITGIDLIMATGFNWAPPSVLVDLMGAKAAVGMIEQAGVPVPNALREAAGSAKPAPFFQHPQLNAGKFFVAS
jgi:3-hydroxyacyl-CoA dehydrogenase